MTMFKSKSQAPFFSHSRTIGLIIKSVRAVFSFLGTIFTLITMTAIVCGLSLGGIFWVYGRDLPSHKSLAQYKPPTISRIYSAEGKIIDEFAKERRLFTPANEIPALIKHAFISSEDKNFYDHPGYDLRGILAALFDAIQSRGKRIRGASTITQQVMKNFLLDRSRRAERKVKEIILATRIERSLSKEQILELYLNEIFLGQNSYGVTAASQTYFNKTLDELAPNEAAFLAALPKAPSDYHPVREKNRLLERRNYVLKEMFQNEYLSKEVYEYELTRPIRSVQGLDYAGFRSELPSRNYFTDEIRRQLSRTFGEEEFFTGGMTVRSTFDPLLQRKAALALQRGLEKYDRKQGVWRGTGKTIPFEILNDEALEIIESNAELMLEEVGVAFVNNPNALELWRNAGADVDGERVHVPKGLARNLIKTAPANFIQHARNPNRSVEIGGNSLVCAPVYGPPFVRDLDGGRRYATIEDFQKFVKLGYMSKWLHHSGGTLCEPTDIPVNKRHLDMLLAHMTLSDKPFMGSVTEPSRAQDSVDMCEILFGSDFVQNKTVMTSLININSPMTFDDVMMGAMEVYAKNNQACIVSPFIVGGAMAPVSIAGTLTQVLAEVLAGVAYNQLIRPGAPVIFGTFVSSIDMNSGAPTFGTPEASHILYGAGQLARRLKLPFRSGGGLCGSKLPDAQAAYESANTLNAALLGGVNFMLHSCGWLEGGLVSSFEKFVMDADQLGVLHQMAKGIAMDENAQALDAIREVGPGGHYLGCAHTQANFKSAFWRSDLFDYKPFETWQEEGSLDTMKIASRRAKILLDNYVKPSLDIGVEEALNAFVSNKKTSMPDSFT